MLTDRQMDAALEIFQRRMQSVTDDYYRRMGEHIRQIGQLAPSDVHRLQQLRRMNANLRDVKKRLAQAAGINLRDLEAVLTEAAKVDDRVARKILGVSDASVQLRNNVPLQRALQAQLAETAGRLDNLSSSTVVQDSYRKAVDAAVTAVQSGAEDYECAIRRRLRKAGEMGLRVRESGTSAVAYQSGLTRRVDTAVRMNVLDAMRRMNQRVMEEVGRQFGADGVEIDAHMLCAEDHLPYQGGQYSNEEFQEIQDSLDRPFGEWNCRHTWAPIIMGVSPPAYDSGELEQMRRYSTEEVEIDGVSHTRYEWSQVMRRMETAIREKKDTATLAAAAGDDQLRRQCQGSIEAMVGAYERLSDRTGLGPDFRRTYVAGFRDVKAGTPPVLGAADAARNTYTPVYYDPNATYAINLPGYNSAVNDGFSVAMRDLAIKGTETGNEHLYLVSLRTGNRSFYETNNSPDSVGYRYREYLREHPGDKFAFVHNHNTDGSLSETDMRTLLNTEQIPVIIAVRNDGVIYVAERKGRILGKGFFDDLYADDLGELQKQLKDGIITPAQRTKRRELIIVNNLLRDYTKGGCLIEYDTRRRP